MDDEIINKHSGEIAVMCVIVIVLCIGGFFYMMNMGKSIGRVSTDGHREGLFAMVKGSIYSYGEAISVFGTCMDGNDIPVVGSTGSLSAWYPNGTQFVFNENMTKISEGYFLYNSTMSMAGGTYLTEFICNVTINNYGYYARAWGEWQNPYWVSSILALLNSINGTNSSTYIFVNGSLVGLNISLSLIEALLLNQTVLINDSTNEIIETIYNASNDLGANITFIQQNMTSNFEYTNSLIVNTSIVANASVDRNDSYLAHLLMLLINTTGAPISGNLTVNETYGAAYLNRWWTDKAFVYNEWGQIVSDPDVYCIITTNQHESNYMEAEGDHFTIDLYITNWGLNWSTTCSY